MSSYPFHGERLSLRAFEADDLDAMGYLNAPELAGRKGLPWGIDETLPLSTRQIASAIEQFQNRKDGFNLAVTLRATGEMIGHVECGWGWDTLCPWIGVVIAPGQQRQGYGTEVANLLIRYLFEQTPAHVISAEYADWNTAGRALADKIGMTVTGRMRWVGLRGGKPYDEVHADILKREWEARA